MRKLMLMVSFLLATLYACNQEEEAFNRVEKRSKNPLQKENLTTYSSGGISLAQFQSELAYLRSIGYQINAGITVNGSYFFEIVSFPAWHVKNGGSGIPSGGFPPNIPARLDDPDGPVLCGVICGDDCYIGAVDPPGFCFGDCDLIPELCDGDGGEQSSYTIEIEAPL